MHKGNNYRIINIQTLNLNELAIENKEKTTVEQAIIKKQQNILTFSSIQII